MFASNDPSVSDLDGKGCTNELSAEKTRCASLRSVSSGMWKKRNEGVSKMHKSHRSANEHQYQPQAIFTSLRRNGGRRGTGRGGGGDVVNTIAGTGARGRSEALLAGPRQGLVSYHSTSNLALRVSTSDCGVDESYAAMSYNSIGNGPEDRRPQRLFQGAVGKAIKGLGSLGGNNNKNSNGQYDNRGNKSRTIKVGMTSTPKNKAQALSATLQSNGSYGSAGSSEQEFQMSEEVKSEILRDTAKQRQQFHESLQKMELGSPEWKEIQQTLRQSKAITTSGLVMAMNCQFVDNAPVLSRATTVMAATATNTTKVQSPRRRCSAPPEIDTRRHLIRRESLKDLQDQRRALEAAAAEAAAADAAERRAARGGVASVVPGAGNLLNFITNRGGAGMVAAPQHQRPSSKIGSSAAPAVVTAAAFATSAPLWPSRRRASSVTEADSSFLEVESLENPPHDRKIKGRKGDRGGRGLKRRDSCPDVLSSCELGSASTLYARTSDGIDTSKTELSSASVQWKVVERTNHASFFGRRTHGAGKWHQKSSAWHLSMKNVTSDKFTSHDETFEEKPTYKDHTDPASVPPKKNLSSHSASFQVPEDSV